MPGSGDPESGGFGGVRSGGTQFHEGSISSRSRAIGAASRRDDSVRRDAGRGATRERDRGTAATGRYIVLEHPTMTPAVYTLYAHLARIAPGFDVGARR